MKFTKKTANNSTNSNLDVDLPASNENEISERRKNAAARNRRRVSLRDRATNVQT